MFHTFNSLQETLDRHMNQTYDSETHSDLQIAEYMKNKQTSTETRVGGGLL